MKENIPLLHYLGVLSDVLKACGCILLFERQLPLSKTNFITLEGAVFYNVLYYRQLSIACYQVSFYANNLLF